MPSRRARSFAQAGQPPALAVAVLFLPIEASAIVLDDDAKPPATRREVDLDVHSVGVAVGIGERLLDDQVDMTT